MRFPRSTVLPAVSLSLLLSLLLVPASRASASPGDDDDDARGAETPVAPARPAGKPVSFDRGWLEPFFEHGPARQAVEQFRAEDWEAAETGFAKAVKSLPRDGADRRAAKYMLALARANQSKWADAGQLFEELLRELPEARAVSRLQRRPVAGCDAATRRARWSGWRGSPRAASRRRRRSWCAWTRCARSGAGATCSRRSRLPCAVAERPAPRRVALQEGGGDGEGVGRRGGDARKAAPDVTAIYRRVWAEAPLQAWGDRAAERLRSDRGGAAGRRGGGRPRAHRGRMGVARHGALRSEPQRRVGGDVHVGAGGARAGRRSRVPRALPPRAVGLEATPAATRGAAVRRGGGRLRARRKPRPAREGALPGGALLRERWGTATSRWRTTRASRRSTPTTATRTTRGSRPAELATDAGDDARRRQAAVRGADALPEGRPARTRRCGGSRSRSWRARARRRGAALAGREPAPRPARGHLVRRGARPVLERARVREAGQDRRGARPGTSAPCASTRCRSTRCCR